MKKMYSHPEKKLQKHGSKNKDYQLESLKPCPFCGQTKSLHFYNEAEQARDKYYCDEDPSENSGVIICDATNGGCGATSGFGSLEDAINKWNIRISNDKTEEHY